jgi:hypothetical protein
MGCCGEDDWVADIAEIPVPTVFEKLFFEKVARLIQYTCDCDPEFRGGIRLGLGQFS